jgi:hypothetical protein
LFYLDEIEKQKPDVVLLDNYFPWETWEEALGEEFLQQVLERNISTTIICISDYGMELMERYFSRENAYHKWVIKWWIANKNGAEIAHLMKKMVEK